MKKLRIPKKLYFKRGCLPVALREMHEVYGLQKAFLITNPALYRKGLADPVAQRLKDSGLHTSEFFTLAGDPSIENVKTGMQKMDEFEPDLIVGVGDEKALSAAKVMWLLYENPDIDVAALAAGGEYPQMGTKAKLVLIPTAVESGCECTPYAEIVDDKSGKKICLNSYNLLPEMAVIDADFTDGLTGADFKKGALQALKNAIGALVVPEINDYAKGYARDAARIVFEDLEKVVADPAKDPVACENLLNAATLAGMGYACAVQDGAPLDEAKTIEELISGAADQTALVELAVNCGLSDKTEYNMIQKVSAECKKVAAL